MNIDPDVTREGFDRAVSSDAGKSSGNSGTGATTQTLDYTIKPVLFVENLCLNLAKHI
jgi:hypothetical protein